MSLFSNLFGKSKPTKKRRKSCKSGVSGIPQKGPGNITKSKIAKDVAKQTGLSASKVNEVITKTTEEISNKVKNGYNVTLANFASFRKVETKARKVPNRKTGQMERKGGGNVPKIIKSTNFGK